MHDLSRRDFVRTTAVSLAAATAAGLGMAPAPSSRRRQPNVLLIILDDLGSIDLNCYGATDLETPNLDALAASGVRLTQFCSGAPICSASRGATLTGRVPQRTGLTGNASSRPGMGSRGAALPPDVPTMATVLKAAGYATGHVGKWHLGYTPETMPNARGFDRSFGHMGGCIDNYSHFFYWDGPNRHDLWEDGREVYREGQYFGDLIAAEAKRFISDHRDRPFFLYWAINEPHYPLQGRAKWRERYKALASPRNMYAAMVSTADELIGEILRHLDSLGLRDDTLIVFQSDHGHSTEERSFFGGGNAGPYRGAKGCLFEGGIRVPAIASYVGVLPAGAVRRQFVTGVDWLPTVSELAGVDLPAGTIEGRSAVPILRSAEAPTNHPVFHWGYNRQWAVRDGDWKLIGNPVDTSNKASIAAGEHVFLSDLSRDVGEMKNLAGEEADRVRRMRAMHEEWAAGFAKTP